MYVALKDCTLTLLLLISAVAVLAGIGNAIVAISVFKITFI